VYFENKKIQILGMGDIPDCINITLKSISNPNGIDNTKITDIYTDGVLPTESISNGQVADINNIIKNLQHKGIIPVVTKTNTEAYLKKQSDLIANIKKEYCWYYSRYLYSVDKLIKAIASETTPSSELPSVYPELNQTASTSIKAHLDNTRILNNRLTNLILIIQKIDEILRTSNTKMRTDLTSFSSKTDEMYKKLISQNEVISSSDAVTKLNKEMVKYTEEKGRYTDNLLKMYSVLNIVALGLLVYIYKSAN
jgi:hypothetical protein